MKKLFLFSILLVLFCSSTSKTGERITRQDIIGTWKFTYIEAFDWSPYGIASDSLEIDFYWIITENEFIEEIRSEDESIRKTATYKYNPYTYKIRGKYHGPDKEIIGEPFKIEIDQLEEGYLDIYHSFPKAHKKEFAMPGYGKCTLVRMNIDLR